MTVQEACAQAYENGKAAGDAEGYARGKAEAVVHGHWDYVGDPDEDNNIQAYCSACGAGDEHATSMIGKVPYCWHCGARMDGDGDA